MSFEPVVVKYWSTLDEISHPLCSVSGLSKQTGNTGLSEAGPEASLSPWSLVLAESSQPEEENKPVAEQRGEADHKSHQQWAKPSERLIYSNVRCWNSCHFAFFFVSPCTFPTGTCPKLDAPINGRKLGKSHSVGHEVHFLCDPGYELVGSESRVCQESLIWSGQQTTCRGESPALISCFSTASSSSSSHQCLSSTSPWKSLVLLSNPLITFYSPVIVLFVTFPSPALYCHSSFCAFCTSPTFFHVEIHFICDPWSYFLFMYFGHCPESLLNAVTCDIPTSMSSDSSLTLR